ncbi:hypothetical protein C8Q78DRAFT_1080631 [Trametes maxima]|nr:hypothetical protein C8Q78DRAFT_1080631 [Trametes maxima]
MAFYPLPAFQSLQPHPRNTSLALFLKQCPGMDRTTLKDPWTQWFMRPAAGNVEATQQTACGSTEVTAAQHVLFSGDILISIFKPFETDRFWNPMNQPDLFRFMLVCKFFFFHATSEGQRGQLRDLNILSEALRNPVRCNNLIYYCGFVRSLLFDTGVVAPEITPILCQLPLDDSTLFCGLQHLYWTESPFGSSDLLHVIGSCLERLTVIVGQNYFGANGIEAAYTHWAQQLIMKVSLLSPSLRYLSLISNGLGVTIPTPNHEKYFSGLHSAPVCVY